MATGPEPRRRKGPGISLWVNPVDDENKPADPVFMEAVLQHGEAFISYRARELQDESLARQLIERAVHAASRARNGNSVRDPLAYVFRTFMHLVDAEIKRSTRFVSLNETLLYARADGQLEIDLEEDYAWQETLESLDPAIRRLLLKILWGNRIAEIAQEIGIRPNTLSKQISRHRREIKNTLDGNRTRARLLEPDGQGNVGSNQPEGASSSRGSKRAA